MSTLLLSDRHAAGVTQEELAEGAGLSVRGLSDLKRGVRQLAYRDTVHRVADALGLIPESSPRFWRRRPRENDTSSPYRASYKGRGCSEISAPPSGGGTLEVNRIPVARGRGPHDGLEVDPCRQRAVECPEERLQPCLCARARSDGRSGCRSAAHFPTVPFAAARIGPGSDILGFDDERSTVHFWGPLLHIFLLEGDHARWADQINRTLAAEPPLEVTASCHFRAASIHSRRSSQSDWLVMSEQHRALLAGGAVPDAPGQLTQARAAPACQPGSWYANCM